MFDDKYEKETTQIKVQNNEMLKRTKRLNSRDVS